MASRILDWFGFGGKGLTADGSHDGHDHDTKAGGHGQPEAQKAGDVYRGEEGDRRGNERAQRHKQRQTNSNTEYFEAGLHRFLKLARDSKAEEEHFEGER